jgi:1,2-diacylglycerol 3-beta-galactosyltransferase
VPAGPGTIAEALISGLPILLNGNVPCQEEGNIPYVVDSGCGIFEKEPLQIADIIDEWFSEAGKELLQTMARNSKALGRPDALFKIVKDLAHLAEHPDLLIARRSRRPWPGTIQPVAV